MADSLSKCQANLVDVNVAASVKKEAELEKNKNILLSERKNSSLNIEIDREKRLDFKTEIKVIYTYFLWCENILKCSSLSIATHIILLNH